MREEIEGFSGSPPPAWTLRSQHTAATKLSELALANKSYHNTALTQSKKTDNMKWRRAASEILCIHVPVEYGFCISRIPLGLSIPTNPEVIRSRSLIVGTMAFRRSLPRYAVHGNDMSEKSAFRPCAKGIGWTFYVKLTCSAVIPVPKPHTQLLGTFHTSNTSSELRTEQASVCSLVGEPPNRGKSSVNRTRCEMPVFEEDAITSNDDLVEGQSRLGAIPLNKFINGVSIAALGLE